VGWSLGLFALLRSPWAEGAIVLPLTRLQEQAAYYYVGLPATPIAVTLECSGTDVLALCLAAILAWPVAWRTRLAGAAGGVALVLALNTVRIATLGLAAASPAFFEALHLQVWPAILVIGTAGYVFVWMRGSSVEGGRADEADAEGPMVRRFAPRAAVLLVAFALSGPLIARSQVLLEAGGWIAHAAAFALSAGGISAAASGNVLATSRGAFIVTPECLATALLPLFIAGILAAPLSWPSRALALLAAPPLFALLAIARLLLLALPQALAASPLFLVHGFHQLVLAVALVVLLAAWGEPPAPRRWTRVAGRAGAALGAAAVFGVVAGASLTSAVLGAARVLARVAPHTLTALSESGDAQGALALLPAYQAGLLLALGVAALTGWRRLLPALGVLVASQIALLLVLGELADRAGWVPHSLLLRAWAVAAPVALTVVMVRGEPRGFGMLASGAVE
jgi:exosortase/archaeosortase family protein